jgi:hypothetical protein
MPRRDRRGRQKTKLEDLNHEELKDYFVVMAESFYDNITDNRGKFNPEDFPFPSHDSSLLILLENKDQITSVLTSREFIDDMGGLDPGIDLDKTINYLFSNIETRLNKHGSVDNRRAWRTYKELKQAYDGGDLGEMQTIYDKYNTDRLTHRSKYFQGLHRKLGERIKQNESLESIDSEGYVPSDYEFCTNETEQEPAIAAAEPEPEPEPASAAAVPEPEREGIIERIIRRCGTSRLCGSMKKSRKKKHTKKKHTKKKKKKKLKRTRQKGNTKRRR